MRRIASRVQQNANHACAMIPRSETICQDVEDEKKAPSSNSKEMSASS